MKRRDWCEDGIILSDEEEQEYKLFKNHFDILTWERGPIHKKIPPFRIEEYKNYYSIQEPSFKEMILGFDEIWVKLHMSNRQKQANLFLKLIMDS